MSFEEDVKLIVSSTEFTNYRTEIFENIINALTGDLIAFKKATELFIKSPMFIRECLFWDKFTMFLEGTFRDGDDKIKLSAVFADNQEKEEYARRILSIIDNIDTKSKVRYISNLTRALLLDLINRADYYRLCNAIRNTLEEDLMFLNSNVGKKLVKSNIHIDFLKQNGLMVQTLISSTSSGEAYDKEEYVFTPYAKMLDQFGLEYGNTDKYDYSAVEKSLLEQTPPTISVGKITAVFG